MASLSPPPAARGTLCAVCAFSEDDVVGDERAGFVVVYLDHASAGDGELADVIVLSPQPDEALVDHAARETLSNYPGCLVVATSCGGARVITHSRDGQRAVLRGGPGRRLDAAAVGAVAYAWLLAGHHLAALRPSDVVQAPLAWGDVEGAGCQLGSWRTSSVSHPIRCRRRSASGLPQRR
ncbi:hypothetical protein SAMN05444320_102318 [Streptoalloteichus hindustanus]|uniref:Uncharacterized protein n=1 Tax=Streptoalloteichus hindustanus TaxID=2017 RepID=A0A1M4YD41_STRHI|nr:hypothetical protein SAMN05444320_102318 [Streptoalloteichus hindustanus]